MNPVLLQKQLKENATDLQDFYKDLKEWGDAMKQMEDDPGTGTKQKKAAKPSSSKKPRTELSCVKKTPTTKPETGPKTKIGTTDYSAWDKFDADAECEKVDYKEDDEESELSDEIDSSQRELAFLEKEKGNTLVRKQKWNEAMKCYTKAIDYYSFDPIFYANRALCYLKTNSMDKAEMDCTLSLKLDSNYVKAYQRRAAAREAQNKLKDAESDLIKVLELEPNNKESQKAFENLLKKLGNTKQETRPLSKFAASRKHTLNQSTPVPNKTTQVDTSSPTSVWKNDGDVIPVRVVNKPPHLRSKKPLKRLLIEEIDETTPPEPKPVAFSRKIIEHKPVNNAALPKPEHEVFSSKIVENKPNIDQPSGTVNVDVLPPKIDRVQEIAGKSPITEISPQTKNDTNLNEAPKNSVQFYSTWKHFKSSNLKYDYLKLIQPREIPNIFKECLESNVLSEILEVLETCFVKNKDGIYDILSNLCKVKRFSTFTMFMSYEDKKRLWKLIDYIKDEENTPKEDVDTLIEIYGL